MRKIGVFLFLFTLVSLSYGQRLYLAGERSIGISNFGAGWIPYGPNLFEYNLNSGIRLGYVPINQVMVGVELNYRLIFGVDAAAGTSEFGRSPGANLFFRYYVSPERASLFVQGNLGGLYFVREDGARTSNAYFGEVLLGFAFRPVDKFSVEVSSGIRRYLNLPASQGGRLLILNFIPKLGANYHF